MKRLLTLCALVASLLIVPAASASTTAAVTLVPSCTTCAVGGSVTFSGTGYKDSTSYFWTYTMSDGPLTQGPNWIASTHGAISFVVAPIPAAGTYQVRVWSTNGRSDPKLIATTYFTAS